MQFAVNKIQQLDLVLKIVIERAGGNPRRRRDLLHGQDVAALFSDQFDRGIENRLLSGLFL